MHMPSLGLATSEVHGNRVEEQSVQMLHVESSLQPMHLALQLCQFFSKLLPVQLSLERRYVLRYAYTYLSRTAADISLVPESSN
jgi:hypothetical protein